MSGQSTGNRTEQDLKQILAPLAETEANVPSADKVYWHAQIRMKLDAQRRGRRTVLRPLRVYQLTIAIGMTSAGALASLWPLIVNGVSSAGLIAGPVIIALASVGAWLIGEANTAGA